MIYECTNMCEDMNQDCLYYFKSEEIHVKIGYVLFCCLFACMSEYRHIS